LISNGSAAIVCCDEARRQSKVPRAMKLVLRFLPPGEISVGEANGIWL
jgi:hypothetical protein